MFGKIPQNLDEVLNGIAGTGDIAQPAETMESLTPMDKLMGRQLGNVPFRARTNLAGIGEDNWSPYGTQYDLNRIEPKYYDAIMQHIKDNSKTTVWGEQLYDWYKNRNQGNRFIPQIYLDQMYNSFQPNDANIVKIGLQKARITRDDPKLQGMDALLNKKK